MGNSGQGASLAGLCGDRCDHYNYDAADDDRQQREALGNPGVGLGLLDVSGVKGAVHLSIKPNAAPQL